MSTNLPKVTELFNRLTPHTKPKQTNVSRLLKNNQNTDTHTIDLQKDTLWG